MTQESHTEAPQGFPFPRLALNLPPKGILKGKQPCQRPAPSRQLAALPGLASLNSLPLCRGEAPGLSAKIRERAGGSGLAPGHPPVPAPAQRGAPQQRSAAQRWRQHKHVSLRHSPSLTCAEDPPNHSVRIRKMKQGINTALQVFLFCSCALSKFLFPFYPSAPHRYLILVLCSWKS